MVMSVSNATFSFSISHDFLGFYDIFQLSGAHKGCYGIAFDGLRYPLVLGSLCREGL